MRRTIIFVGCSLAALLVAAASILFHLFARQGLVPEPIRQIDPAGFRAVDLGVPKVRVVALANLLGVDPQKIGPNFPVDYYEDLLLSPPPGKRMSRAEVMATMKGYAAMCDVFADKPGRALAYFFFAADDTKPMEEAPSVVVLFFTSDQVGSIMPFFLDGDTRYEDFEGCIAERGTLGVMPE